MSLFKIKVDIEIDGQRVPGFSPYVHVIEVDEKSIVTESMANGGGYLAQADSLAALKVLAQYTDTQVTSRLDGQSDAGIVLNSGGLLLVVNGTIDASASTNVTTDNSSGATAKVTTVAGGS